MKTSSIQISREEHFLGEGAYCTCYHHPIRPELCIKIPTLNKKSKRRLKEELKAHHKLKKHTQPLNFISNYIGSCSTNLGEGEIFEKILMADGSPAIQLHQFLEQKPSQIPYIIDALLELREQLLTKKILISDLHTQNILVSTKVHPHKLVIIDGLGDRVLIPILNIMNSAVIGKITRRWNRFIMRMNQEHTKCEIPTKKLLK